MGNRNHGIVPERVGDGQPESSNDDGLPVGAMRRADWAKLDYEVVYFTGTENGPIKIGRSISLVRRIRELQVGHPGLLHVWAVVPGNNLEEAIYHHRFAKDRIWGEWFARSDEMQEFLDDRAAMRGDLRLPAPRQRDGLPQRNGGACDDCNIYPKTADAIP